MPEVPGPFTFDAFVIQRVPHSATPLNLIYPSRELAEQVSPRQGPVRQAGFTLQPGEALAVAMTGTTDNSRLFLDFPRAYAAAQEARGYVVILTPSSWPIMAEDGDGVEVLIGERMAWEHDFLHRRLVFAD